MQFQQAPRKTPADAMDEEELIALLESVKEVVLRVPFLVNRLSQGKADLGVLDTLAKQSTWPALCL